MTTYKALLVGSIQLYLLLLITVAVSFASEKGAKEVTSITKVSQKADQVDLVGQNMCITTATATSQVVEVNLIMTENRCRIRESSGGKTEERELFLWCYELKARDETIPYSRAVWTSRPVKGFKLFTGTKGKNYLAWVDGSSVRIEEVSQPKGTSAALVGYLSKSDRYIVPVTHLAGRSPFEGLDAIHCDIDIISVGEDESGRLHLVLKAPKMTERFEFVFDGKNWARGISRQSTNEIATNNLALPQLSTNTVAK